MKLPHSKQVKMDNGVTLDFHPAWGDEGRAAGAFVLWAYPPDGWTQKCVGGLVTPEQAFELYERLKEYLCTELKEAH